MEREEQFKLKCVNVLYLSLFQRMSIQLFGIGLLIPVDKNKNKKDE